MSDKMEPTLHDVLSSIADLSEAMQTGFARVEGDINGLQSDVTSIRSELHELTRRTGTLEVNIEDMQETLTAMSKAGDEDSEILLKQGARIARIEKVLELPAV